MFSQQVPPHATAALVLADGSVFWGKGIGAPGTTGGEVCFNTSMTGYQEIMTDPSYAGQIITFTFPHIGNTGANDLDDETGAPFAKGLVLRADITAPASWRSEGGFDGWLKDKGLTGICGVDTRALTRHLRDKGAQNGIIHYAAESETLDIDALKKEAQALPAMAGLDMARTVTCKNIHTWSQGPWNAGKDRYETMSNEDGPHVVVIDYGVKRNILRCLAAEGLRLTVVPCDTAADDVMALKPDGIFLSNGPGDPAATGAYAVPVIKALLDSGLPMFGICLGHQMLALALGGRTEKLPFGHRGANHPVKDIATGKVEITSQNHGFHVIPDSLPDMAEPTHVSLFDGTNEGLRVKGRDIFSVQFRPEASPGPQDSYGLFSRFATMLRNSVRKTA